jgi:hypothetical protein
MTSIDVESVSKKPYVTPELTRFGAAVDLTAGIGWAQDDGFGGEYTCDSTDATGQACTYATVGCSGWQT